MTHPTDDSLKPCPFCGSQPEPAPYVLKCVNAYCEAQPSVSGGNDDECATAWNKRALLAEQARTEPDLDTQRADFHKWCATNGYKTDFVEGGECPMGLPVYADHKTHAAWWAFQKAAKLYAAPLLKAEQAKDAAEDAELLDRYGKIRGDLKASAYCVGNEYKPFHPSASHVRPEWRDGWNACYVAAIRAARAAERKA